MKITNLNQGSAEWHAHRAKHFSASELAAAVGASSYLTRSALLKAKATGIEPEVDAETQRRFDDGHAYEAMARQWAEEIIGTELYPVVLADDVDGLPLSASLDGLTMLEDTAFEHKTLNPSLAASLDAGVIPEEYHWQMEQCLMLSGAQRCLFMASNGNRETMRHAWYTSRPEIRQQIIPVWKAFREDLASYRHVEDAPKPVGRAPDTLPTLYVEVTGAVTASNLEEFKAHALAVIAGINTNLQTDEDFANAEKTVKWCGEVEDRLEATKAHALAQTTSIDELFRAIDDIMNETRLKRLNLEKLVKARKEQIRREIVDQAVAALRAHVQTLNERIGKPYMPEQDTTRFGMAIKGLKTLASLRNAVDTELANAKIAASAVADQIELNLKTLRELAPEHGFLFHDERQIVLKQPDDLTALVKSRIADHKAAEERRLEAERERIRQEEQERIRKEEQAKAAAAPTTPLPVAPPSQPVASAPAPAEPTTPKPSRSEVLVSLYIAGLADGPKKKAEIKKHLLAFMEFCREQGAVESRRAG